MADWNAQPTPGGDWLGRDPDDWIMQTAFWRDIGIWVDFPALWHDYPVRPWQNNQTPGGNWGSPDSGSGDWYTPPPPSGNWQDV